MFLFNPNLLHTKPNNNCTNSDDNDVIGSLGMAMSKNIVESHNGSVNLTSEGLGNGCTLSFSLPVHNEIVVKKFKERAGNLLKSINMRSGKSSKSVSLGSIDNKATLHIALTNEPDKQQSDSMKSVSSIQSSRQSSMKSVSSIRGEKSFEGEITKSSLLMSEKYHQSFSASYSEKSDHSSIDEVKDDDSLPLKNKKFHNLVLSSLKCKDDETHVIDLDAQEEKVIHDNSSEFIMSRKESMHVLVIEDSKTARTMLMRVLKTMGYTCEEAEDGAVAVDIVQNNELSKFDLILSDNSMPNMNGPQAVKKIRELGYIGPIFGVTGNMLPVDVEDFMAHGVNTVLGKPVKVATLKTAVSEYCK